MDRIHLIQQCYHAPNVFLVCFPYHTAKVRFIFLFSKFSLVNLEVNLPAYEIIRIVPCYTFLYNHVSESMRAKIDQREQQVAEAEAAKPSGDKKSLAGRARHAVRNTFITKHLVNLFIKNMSAHDENEG
jgi:hypothetical protein